jgi:hypothetical protein
VKETTSELPGAVGVGGTAGEYEELSPGFPRNMSSTRERRDERGASAIFSVTLS